MGLGIRLGPWTVVALLVALVFAAAAQAAFPGGKGRIAFTRYDSRTGLTDVYNVEHDGMAQFRVTADGVSGTPAYSPDGERLAFASGGALVTTDAFGNGRTTVIGAPLGASDPDWSPDGERLVISMPNCDPEFDCATDIYVVEADGTGLTNLTGTIFDEFNPAWSPDGAHIAFDSARAGETDVYVMDSDGTGVVNVTDQVAAPATEPEWAPDASRIAYQFGSGVQTANPDGSGVGTGLAGSDPAWSPNGAEIALVQSRTLARAPAGGGTATEVTADPFDSIYLREPDWQPAEAAPPPAEDGSGYPRPRATIPARFPLVVAYVPCPAALANRQHGPPLAFPSCSPPSRESTLKVGTPDANGQAANAEGYVRILPIVGDPSTPADEADVRLLVSQTDVRRGPNESDFVGELTATAELRITDKWNGGALDGSATVLDFELRFSIPCTGTADVAIGGACGLDTTADALVPGLVPERKRSIWALGRVAVLQDPNPDFRADDRLFLSTGVFVP